MDNITSIVEHIHCSSGGNSEIESQLDTILSVVDGICDCVSTSSGCGSAIINQLDNIASVVEGLCDCVCDCVSSAASDIEQLITDVFDDLTIDIMVNEMETQDLLSSKIDAVCPCVINSLPPSCPVTLVYNTTPQPLTKPGRYCLAEDIVSIGMAAISIAGSSITLDLNGHRIIGGLGGFAGGIVVENGSNDIRIKNGLITDVTPGINILAASDVRIEDITCSHCTDGIATFTGADGIVISNVICDGTGTGVGLNCGGVNIVVADSIFTHNGPAGASFASANNFVVERCEMSANSGTGLIISNSNNFNVLSCSMNGNQTGLLLNNVTGVIKNSSAASNMGPVAMLTPWIGSGFGVYLNNINGDSSSLVFEECTAHDNVGHGFNISTTSKYIGIVKNCIAFSNNGNGFNNGQLSAQFYGNNAYGNLGYGFNTNPGSGQYYANYACDNTLGNYNDVTTAPVTSAANARGVDNVDCSNSTLDEIDVLNSKIDYLINYLTM